MLSLRCTRAGKSRDRMSRRQLLEIGGMGLLGLGLPDLLRADAHRSRVDGRPAPRAKSCIVLFLAGGPSHLDMWDMKPEAPVEIRGEFKPVPTTVPGLELCELLPRLARQAHRTTLVRSMHHDVAVAHWAATYYALTGSNQGDATTGRAPSPTDFPSLGSVVSLLRPPDRPVVPYVSLPHITVDVPGSPPQPGVYGGWLGRAWDPLFVLNDPNDPQFAVPELTLSADVSLDRLGSRRSLLEQLNRQVATFERSPAARNLEGYYARAFSILTSADTRRAFQLDQEPDAVRDAYGRNTYGQSILLARRLIEAGTRVVTLKWAPDVLSTWDTHKKNFEKLREELLPQLDAGLSSLLDDLHQRGLLDETLVVVMGEFGRTPKIGTVNANAVTDASGRDHWPHCYTLLLAGGGIAPGRIYGRSDKTGSQPVDHAATPHDLVATIYTLLGIAPDSELIDQLNRPHRLVAEGRVLAELFA
jgi:hypothetical protein